MYREFLYSKYIDKSSIKHGLITLDDDYHKKIYQKLGFVEYGKHNKIIILLNNKYYKAKLNHINAGDGREKLLIVYSNKDDELLKELRKVFPTSVNYDEQGYNLKKFPTEKREYIEIYLLDNGFEFVCHPKSETIKYNGLAKTDNNKSQKTSIPSNDLKPKYNFIDNSKIDFNNIEKDMLSRESNGSEIDKIYVQYPILGSKILSRNYFQEITKNTKTIIDKYLDGKESISINEKMIVTLAIINYAKNLKNVESNSKFWNYIALQLGRHIDEDDTKLIKFFKESIYDALKTNNKFMLEQSDPDYITTVFIHSFTPLEQWISVVNMLYDFYYKILDCNITDNDPLIIKLVKNLINKIQSNDRSDLELPLNSNKYNINYYIKSLILSKPSFTCILFQKLIVNIDKLLSIGSLEIENYEDLICENWFKQKQEHEKHAKQITKPSQRIKRQIATKYSHITAKYILKNEKDIYINIPDIRLETDEVNIAEIIIYTNNKIIYRKKLDYYGNKESGFSIKSTNISLKDILSNTNNFLIDNVKAEILCNGEIIYNSKSSLSCSCLIFDNNGKFLSKNFLKEGSFTIIINSDSKLKGKNFTSEEIVDFTIKGLKAYYVKLANDYFLYINDTFVSSSKIQSQNISDYEIELPKECIKLPQINFDNEEYYLSYFDSECKFIFKDDNMLKKYLLIKGQNSIILENRQKEYKDNKIIVSCPVKVFGKDKSCIILKNILNDKVTFSGNFFFIQKASFMFNKEFYYSNSDYNNATLDVEILDNNSDEIKQTLNFNSDTNELQIPCFNGIVNIKIPKICISENTGKWLNNKEKWFKDDIPQESYLTIESPIKSNISFKLGKKVFQTDKLDIGNIIYGENISKDEKYKELGFIVNDKEYILGRIYFKETFTKEISFRCENNILFIDNLDSFIGKENQEFNLSLISEDGEMQLKDKKINKSINNVILEKPLKEDNYRYEITLKSNNIFKKANKTIIAEGDFVNGDINKLRFKNKKIILDLITDEVEEKKRQKILPCFIRDIKFKDIENTSDGLCPIYEGILSYEENGLIKDFSDKEEKGKEEVNPIKIVYINDGTIFIESNTGDGILYTSHINYKTYKAEYYLTDISNKKYSCADLYSFHTERL